MRKLINKIGVMKSNKHYRIGDLIFHYGDCWKRDILEILKNDKYEGSLLQKYFSSLKNPAEDSPNVKLFRNIIYHNFRKKNLCKEVLYVHLRTGDYVLKYDSKTNFVLKYDDKTRGSYGSNLNSFLYSKNDLLDRINEITRDNNITKIMIVTSMQFGNRWKYSIAAINKNKALLKELLEFISNHTQIEIDILDNKIDDIKTIDYHFSTLVIAKNVILDKGGFAEVIRKIRNKRTIFQHLSSYFIARTF